jgi:hypothetical protein
MSTLLLEFDGYFQMRMATDPDPTDEKRGVSGYTFALAGEPDLDATLHFQPDEPGVWQRKFGVGERDGDKLPIDDEARGPRVGVLVRSASIDGKEVRKYRNARIQLLGAQVLEHNGILVRNDYFFIDPLHVRITDEDGDVIAERKDWVNPADPSMPLWEATSAMLLRRQPTAMQSNSPMVAAATGLPDAANETLIANRRQRQLDLIELLAVTTDETERAALTTRIEQLDIVTQWWNLSVGTWTNRPIDRRAHQLTLLFDGWTIDVQGNVIANGVKGDPSAPWPLRFWMGGWDGDAMTGFVKGSWTIPLL